ncbi:MAG: hypothetical protein M0Z50_04740 [Planctomycetia bacterium]|nr:hypothetical protein [Planctomycetia bacterium]
MGHLDAILQADAAAMLADFGETITVIPASGEPYTIQAIVDRADTVRFSDSHTASTPRCMITVQNDPKMGIPSAGLDTGTWKVQLALRLGGAVGTYSIALPHSGLNVMASWHDLGILTLEVR